jgi:hypothetical protein
VPFYSRLERSERGNEEWDERIAALLAGGRLERAAESKRARDAQTKNAR